MACTLDDVRQWLHEGKAQGKTHVLIVVDEFDYTNYPVYVSSEEDVHEIFNQYHKVNMQRVMEVYKLSMNIECQLMQEKTWYF